MKRKLLSFFITGLISTWSLTAFSQQNEKAADARREVAHAKKELKEAKLDSAADFEKFRKDAELKITENHKKIAELKMRKSNDTKEVKEKYDKKVLALDQKNNALRKRINAADNTKTTLWASFKQGFNHDMDELERAIKIYK